jgi:A/G-specific adenine glycosylase
MVVHVPTVRAPATLDVRTIASLRRALLAWFRRGHRDLPWRRTGDPYAIWISEIMLQQTRVETVRDYFQRWMTQLPTVRALAAAPLDQVLALWSGLGYYARARNLHGAAALICAEHGGELPRDPAALRALPGVGDYTAGAIASIAFGLPEPILDGNVARVLSRVFLVEGTDGAARARLWELARALVPEDAASHFNQAMMELGALVCSPHDPACGTCPIARRCLARRAGRQLELPHRKPRRVVPTVERIALLLRRPRRAGLLLGRRPPRGLWGGLWEPPCAEDDANAGTPAAQARQAALRFGLKLSRVRAMGTYRHELTHRRYHFRAVAALAAGPSRDWRGAYDELRWVAPGELANLGLSAWARRVIDDALRLPKEGPP